MSRTSDLAESAIETKEQLVANLRRVIVDAEDLLSATALTLLVLPTFAAKAVKHRKTEGIED